MDEAAMNVHIALVTYALDVTPLVSGCYGGDITWHIFQHGNKPEVLDTCARLAEYEGVHYYNYRVNRGLARSWNEGILISQAMDADAIIIINDDVMASADDIMILANAAVEHREAGVIVCEGFNKRMDEHQILGHAVFAINPIALERVGYFDENYWPLYGEDTDYSCRCRLSGITYYNAGNTSMVHEGSATANTAKEIGALNQITFPKNAAYHAKKWGGGYDHEQWTVPFGDGRFDLKIRAEDRHCPYGEEHKNDAIPA